MEKDVVASMKIVVAGFVLMNVSTACNDMLSYCSDNRISFLKRKQYYTKPIG